MNGTVDEASEIEKFVNELRAASTRTLELIAELHGKLEPILSPESNSPPEPKPVAEVNCALSDELRTIHKQIMDSNSFLNSIIIGQRLSK